MTKLSTLINNKLDLKDTDSYCGILGESPSKGARSPVLWNACFEAQNISSYFYPFDVQINGLEKLINYLKEDKNFFGGAVAVPHKEAIISMLDGIEDEAKLIGAVNLIYQKDGLLYGANTDGIGAVASLAKHLNSSIADFANGKKVTLLGTGGAAKACAVYFAKCAGPKGEIIIVGRNIDKAKSLSEKCGFYSKSDYRNFNSLQNELRDSDFLINCTVLGYENTIKSREDYFYYEPFSPLGTTPKSGFSSTDLASRREWIIQNKDMISLNHSESLSVLAKLKSTAVVMDIVYQPEPTVLLKFASMLGYNTLSGKRMNLLQAAYSFQKAFSYLNIPLREIINIMKKA